MQAQAAWTAGRWHAAREVAKRVLAGAPSTREPHLHAQACLLVAQSLSLESQFGLAARFASRARALFGQQQDPHGATESALLASYVEGALGHEVEALAAADAVATRVHGVQGRAAAGLTYRGIASIWGGEYAAARGVLETACRLAPEEADRSASAFHPLVNAIFAAVLESAELRWKGHRADLAQLEVLLSQAWALVKAGNTRSLADIPALPGMFLLSFATCFLASRTGPLERADRYYLKCLEYASMLPPSSWMHTLVWWARLERTTAAREVNEAALSAQRMLHVAFACEHRPMRALARRLGSEAQEYLGGAASPHATFM